MHEAQPFVSLVRFKEDPRVNRRDGNRVTVTMEGYCSINGGHDIACSTTDISMSGVSLMALSDPKLGDEVKLSLSQIGLLQGRVTRLLPMGFAVEFDETLSTKLVRVVNWLRHGTANHERMRDEREHNRIVPLKKLAKLTRENGTEMHSRIIDLSRSGIAVNNMRGLFLRERVKVGTRYGTVSRCWPEGAAIEFDEALPKEDFDISIEFV